ncbi:MAG: peptidylprolyl isomerase [Porphyrobacter sp.]|nr:peptidylprolyl isomerase [Porphyrobacter sp.]
MGTFGRLAAVAAACALAAGLAAAQDVQPGEDAAADSGFNIPSDVKMLGKMDPNKRHATAKVNGQIITGTDIDQRVALVLAANQDAKVSDEQLQGLRLQVLRNLIDETLQIEEAKAQKVEVKPEEVEQAYERLAAQRFNQTPAELDKTLRAMGSSPASLKRQIEGELAWNNLIERNVSPFVSVSGEEVNDLIKRMQESRGTAEYRIGEIYLSATPETRDAVFQNAKKLVDQIHNGGSFPAYARQFSEASTASVGGDLGWIRLEQLQNPTLEGAVQQLQPGQLAGPIEIPGGFDILALIDKRQIGMPDPRDAVLSLKQVSLDFPKGIAEADARQKTQAFAEGVKAIHGCGEVDAAAAKLGAQVVSNDQVQVRGLPDVLQQTLLQLNVGEATPLIGSLTEGVRVLFLCGRDDPKVAAAPDRDQLQSQLEEDRVGKRSQRYLRDLRRDAVIEYDD